MSRIPARPGTPPSDQADGLRRLFDGRLVPVLGVVSNPHLPWSGLLIEHLLSALSSLGHHPLIVDAAPTAPDPDEWALLDLRWAAVSRLESYSHIGARGAVTHHLTGGRSAASVLQSAADAAPWADVIVVHAAAEDLGRLLDGLAWSPLLLADIDEQGLMHAYASLKRLSRWRLPDFSLLIESARHPSLGPRLAGRFDDSARRFLSWPMHRAVSVQGPVQEDDMARAQMPGLLAELLAIAPQCRTDARHTVAAHRVPPSSPRMATAQVAH